VAFVVLGLVFDGWTWEVEDAPVAEVADCAGAGEDKGAGCAGYVFYVGDVACADLGVVLVGGWMGRGVHEGWVVGEAYHRY